METKTLAGYVMALTVSIICVAAILVPTLNDVTYSTSETLTNEGVCFMEEYGADAEFTAVWDYTTPKKITINGEAVDIPSADSPGKYMMLGNGGIYLTASNTRLNLNDTSSAYAVMSASVSDSSNMTITAGNGDLTFTVGGTTKTYEITETFYFIAENGDYVLKDEGDVAYLSSQDSFFIVSSMYYLSGNNVIINGTIEDGFTVEGLYYDVTSDNHVINCTSSSNYPGIYEFTGVTFDASIVNTNLSHDGIEQEIFVVPYEVNYTVSSALTDYSGILSVIPLVIIAAIVFGSVALVATRRD